MAEATDISKFEIIKRPTKVVDPVYHATPERLVEVILQTADNGLAVRYRADYLTVQGIYNKIGGMVRRKGKKIVMQSERPRDRAHRVKAAPYNVIMWVEDRA